MYPSHPSDVYGNLSKAVPMPTDFSISRPIISNTLLIRSASRDLDRYPQSETFNVTLPKRWQMVKGIRLLHANIPRVEYTISEYNQKFSWREIDGGSLLTVSLSPGIYPISSASGDSICSLLQAAMLAESAGSSYSVVYNEYTNKVTITQTAGTGYFEIPVGENSLYSAANSLAQTLGFLPQIYADQVEYEANHTYQYDDLSACVLQVSLGGRQLGKVVSDIGELNGALAIIWANLDKYEYHDTSVSSTSMLCEQQPVLGKMERIEIRLLRLDGKPMRLYGQNWSATLEIFVVSPA